MRDDPVDELYRLVGKLARELEDIKTQITKRGTPGAHASSHQSGGSDAISSFGNLTISGTLGTGTPPLLTIASGVVTATCGYHRVDTESSAASDDLDTINGGVVGMRLVLQTQASTRDVTVKDNTGNIQLAGSADFVLDNIFDKIELIYTAGSRWEELCRSNNA